MTRVTATKLLAGALVAGVLCQAAAAAEADACQHFKWDVARELAVMQQPARAITAAAEPGAHPPQLDIGTLYSLKLADQNGVRFAVGLAKARDVPGAHAGLAQFRVKKTGRYRVSITTGHWVDVVDGVQLVPSVDFQGHVGCARPSKIVEYDLPAEHTLTLQFSGASDSEVTIAITAVATP